MTDFLWAIDASTTLFLSRLVPHVGLTDWIFAFFSIQGLTVCIWLLILAIFFLYEERIHRDFILYFLSAIVPTFVLGNYILKHIFQRLRPWQFFNIQSLSCPTDFSFPSSHAATAFAGAVLFAHFDRKRSWLYYTLASLIAYSRMYLLCHYFSDVVAGGALGGVIGMFTIKLMKRRHRYSKSSY